jgi:outer membrane protein assembly factor BamA
VPAQAISAEDGVRAGVTLRRRFELDPLADRDQSYTQLTLSSAAYKSAGGSGFAHNVLAARANLVHRSALGAGPTDIGGAEGFLPLRGHADNARIGFSAWTASLEYRLPLAFIARGYRLRPLFIDRMRAAFFVDAGNASCTEEQKAFYLSCAGSPARPDDVLLAGGFEVAANVAALSFSPAWVRLGIGFPLGSEEKKNAQIYLTFVPSF